MKFPIAAVVAAGVYSSQNFARNSNELTIRSSLASLPRGWIKDAPAPDSHILKLHIGLTNPSTETIRKHLDETSNPSHSEYGKHLTYDQMASLSSPSLGSLDLVRSWLSDFDIPASAQSLSPLRDWISTSIPISTANRMLNASYFIYRSTLTDTSIIRTESYSLPKFLDDHVDVVAPTNWFSSLHIEKTGKIDKPVIPQRLQEHIAPFSSICNASLVTSECLRTFYGAIDFVPRGHDENKLGVTGYLGEAANFTDLQLFLADQRPDAVNSTFSVTLINGGQNHQHLNQTQLDHDVGQEANLDIQTAFGAVFPVPVTFYSTGGSPTSFNPDASTTTNSNEPYLEFLEYMLSQKDLPSVISTSFGDDEQTVPLDLARRVCDDLMKLGARGVSLIFSSGDHGVGSSEEVCVSNDGKKTSMFLPQFPSTCPYVTSVGATMNFSPEIAAEHPDPDFPFFSGAGFSNYFPRPFYQTPLVDNYIESLSGLHNGFYNATGRGFPDISAQGLNYKIIWNGKEGTGSGTSASTPLVASFIALLNDIRLSNGLPSFGFLNPWLYSIGHSGFNDITIGNSTGCGTSGFPAAIGWDAVTGFGTPNFTKLQQLALRI